MTKKMKQLKDSEDRINANLGAVYSENKEIRAALYLLGHDRASERLERANHLLLVARAEFARIRRTKPTPEKNPNIKRYRDIEWHARGWLDAIDARRRGQIKPGHRDFPAHIAKILKHSRALRRIFAEGHI